MCDAIDLLPHQKIQGSGLKARVKVRTGQKIVIDLGGVNNRVAVPKAMRDQVNERVNGVRNEIEYR